MWFLITKKFRLLNKDPKRKYARDQKHAAKFPDEAEAIQEAIRIYVVDNGEFYGPIHEDKYMMDRALRVLNGSFGRNIPFGRGVRRMIKATASDITPPLNAVSMSTTVNFDVSNWSTNKGILTPPLPPLDIDAKDWKDEDVLPNK